MSTVIPNTPMTRAEMARVLLNYPQFAHVTEKQVYGFLDKIYHNINGRHQEVIPAFAKELFRYGKIEKFYPVYNTVLHFSYEYSVFCCLCGNVHDGDMLNSKYSDELSSFVCDEMLIEDDTIHDTHSHRSYCRECYYDMNGHSSTDPKRKDDVVIKIHTLVTKKKFRNRLNQNRETWNRVRFDPRKREETK